MYAVRKFKVTIKQALHFICLGVLVLLLAYGCSSSEKKPRFYHHSYHVVKKGETLSSIGWRYGVSVKQLAQWNNISPPYTIYPGQKLRLHSSAASTAKRSQKKTATKPTVKAPATPVGKWHWPVRGKLIGKFSNKNNGIDIAAKEGTKVLAAAAGKVVYAGDSLRGYGNLLIIKHNSIYLSAYAHNRKLLVAEGDKVEIAQPVAEVGKTGADRVKLHFEIRKDGNPVDPLRYLPK